MQIGNKWPHQILVDEIEMTLDKKSYRILAKDEVGKFIVLTRYIKQNQCFVTSIFSNPVDSNEDCIECKTSKTKNEAEWTHLEMIIKLCNQVDFIFHNVNACRVN